jgi:hypothetical protein
MTTKQMSAFEKMKANRDKALEQLEDTLSKTSGAPAADPSFWAPSRGEDGNGTAVFRFLPPSDGETTPFVRMFSHSFRGPTGQFYIENSLTTIGGQDAVSDHNKMLWATETEANRKLASERKRKLTYISNVYVIKDPLHPENEGKVFKYKYGQKIMDMVKSAWKPEFAEDDEGNAIVPVKPFDLYEGANFNWRAKTVETMIGGRKVKVPDYTASTHAKPKPLFVNKDGSANDTLIEEVFNQQHKLEDELAPTNFKSPAELKARFFQVIGEGSSNSIREHEQFMDDEQPKAAAPKQKATAKLNLDTSADDNEKSWFDDLDLS